ncbi:X-linked retinitis pigmentosa GTPase regulator-like isoform X2 [Varroa destructor]|uniref:RCC1-like domain-containing protein n=1 Tax=Varroa destructor TaxID=109461 RepID=A0A7M7JF15_VARDE|nr:X-linked retinitis pigmentosa GTPase regulator-like isoform X2 [Varroa destructor]
MNLQILLDVIITRREYRFSWQEYPLFALIITYDCSSFREMTKAEDNKFVPTDSQTSKGTVAIMARDTNFENVEQDIPELGAVFTFGKSKFSDNLPGTFWVKNDVVISVACGDQHSVFITASGRAFSFGSNDYGQLGQSHTKPLVNPRCIKALKDKRAILVACGRSHTLIATDEKNVYAFGINSEHQLGVKSSAAYHAEPQLVSALAGVQIKALAAGADHSMALSAKGIVYLWGSSEHGQLGLGRKKQRKLPVQLKTEGKALGISAGAYHSAYVNSEGHLFTFGESEHGKLGTNLAPRRCRKPSKVPDIQGTVTSVACGGSHTVALTSDGRAYSFGDGSHGQLGLGSRITHAGRPHLVQVPTGVRMARVSAGQNHTAFLSDGRQLFTCGEGRHGKLALEDGEMGSDKFSPMLVDILSLFQVQQVSCGGCHTLVLVVPGLEDSQGNRMGDSPISAAVQATELTLARLRRRYKRALSYADLYADENDAEKRLSRHYLNLDDSTAFATLRYIDSDVESDVDDENANISAASVICADGKDVGLKNGSKKTKNGGTGSDAAGKTGREANAKSSSCIIQ